MTGHKRDSSASNGQLARLFVWTVLSLGAAFSPATAMAAENYFHLQPPSALPPPILRSETRIPAAQPAASAAHANYLADDNSAAHDAEDMQPEGRLRLRPMNFRGF